MTLRAKLNLKEVMYLIVNKPLVIVKIEHSATNKKLIIKALNTLWKDRKGQVIFETLTEFLKQVAPRYELDKNQDGVRRFLLREMEKIATPVKERGLAAMFRFGMG